MPDKKRSKSDNTPKDKDSNPASNNKEASVTIDMLAWARLTAGLTREAVSQQIPELTVDQLTWLERGTEKPTWGLLKQLSVVYNRPISAFFLDNPPVSTRRSAVSISIQYDDGTEDTFPILENDTVA